MSTGHRRGQDERFCAFFPTAISTRTRAHYRALGRLWARVPRLGFPAAPSPARRSARPISLAPDRARRVFFSAPNADERREIGRPFFRHHIVPARSLARIAHIKDIFWQRFTDGEDGSLTVAVEIVDSQILFVLVRHILRRHFRRRWTVVTKKM